MSSSEENVQSKITGEFKNNVKNWLKIDDTIRELRAKSKELLKEKKLHEDFILNFLESVEEKSVGVPNGKLTRYVSQTKAPLKKENIQKALIDITGDTNKALSMTEHILKSRATVERVSLKRTKGNKNN